jgi:hypothetical protein
MTDDYLIHGINPLTISGIGWKKGRREGRHRYYDRLFERKLLQMPRWKRALARWYQGDARDYWVLMYWSSARVCIYGANGKLILEIACRSNARAEELREELNQKLNNFLKNLQRIE